MQPTLQIVTPDFAQHPLDAEDLRSRVDKAVDDFLAHQADVLDAVGDDLAPLMDALGRPAPRRQAAAAGLLLLGLARRRRGRRRAEIVTVGGLAGAVPGRAPWSTTT